MPHKTIQRIIGTHFSSSPSPFLLSSRFESQSSHTRDSATSSSSCNKGWQAGMGRGSGSGRGSQLVSQAATQSATPVKLLGAYVRRHKINK